MGSLRVYVHILLLALLLSSQQILSQAPSSAQPSASSASARTAKPNQGNIKCTDNGTYVNSEGQTVQRPENCSGPPREATAQCRDGSYSFSRNRRGTCSHHGGVARGL
jgi:hypothetical protein